MFKKDWFNQMKRQTSTRFATKHRIEHITPKITEKIVLKRFEVDIGLFLSFLQQIIKSRISRLYKRILP